MLYHLIKKHNWNTQRDKVTECSQEKSCFSKKLQENGQGTHVIWLCLKKFMCIENKINGRNIPKCSQWVNVEFRFCLGEFGEKKTHSFTHSFIHFSAVLSLQQNWDNGTETSHDIFSSTFYTFFSLLSIRFIVFHQF